MGLLLDIGRLTVAYRSDIEGTAIRWNGRRHRWRLGMMERNEGASRLLPSSERLLDRHAIAEVNDWGTTDRDVQVAVGPIAVWWDHSRAPDNAKVKERQKAALARFFGDLAPIDLAQELDAAA